MMHMVVSYDIFSAHKGNPAAANISFSAPDGSAVTMTVHAGVLGSLVLGKTYVISLDEYVETPPAEGEKHA